MPEIPVTIDIKPGSVPNSINPKGRGKIPVAILSTSAFDAVSQVDPGSLQFGRIGDEASLAFCNFEDVDGDARVDMSCHFDTATTAFRAGDTKGILTGTTLLGRVFRGEDSIRVVPQ